MQSLKIFLICAAMTVICCVLLFAQATPLPDLTVDSLDCVPIPKEYGPLDLIKICVANKGSADAAACTLSLSCAVIKCYEGNKCEDVSRLIHADIAVPPIKKGEITNLEWRPSLPVKWVPGKYSVSADIDEYNVVQESNETNNVIRRMIYTASLSPRRY